MKKQKYSSHIRFLPYSFLTRGRFIFNSRKFTSHLRDKYGSLLVIGDNPGDMVLCLKPDAAQEVLKLKPANLDAFFKNEFGNLAGSGSMWVLDGLRHKRERKLLISSFQPRSYSQIDETIKAAVQDQIKSWRVGETYSAVDEMLSISLVVVLTLVFGELDDDQVEKGKVIFKELLHSLHPQIVFFTFFQSRWFFRWRRYDDARNDFSTWLKNIIRVRRKENKKTESVLDLMLSATYEDGRPLQEEHIRDELLTVLLAGHETTATALAWALYELSINPDVLAKLREEIGTLGPEPVVDELVNLPYLSAVCNETLRYHTLLAEIGRVTNCPVEISGEMFAPGTSFLISVMAIHFNPELYPDPEKFKPERFLERSYSPYEFLPFGGGHRRCLGAAISDYEMRIVLAEIVRHWDIEAVRREVDIRHDIAMGPKYGIPVKFYKRV